jgi:hypothetical protein
MDAPFVLAYLQMIHDANPGVHPTWDWPTVHAFVLDQGLAFTPAALPASVARGELHACYKNALELAVFYPEDFFYVEGFAYGVCIPVAHAWCVDRQGHVIEPTWPDVGREYLGVPLDITYVRRVTLQQKRYGIIDNWMSDWPILQGQHTRERWAVDTGLFCPPTVACNQDQ